MKINKKGFEFEITFENGTLFCESNGDRVECFVSSDAGRNKGLRFVGKLKINGKEIPGISLEEEQLTEVKRLHDDNIKISVDEYFNNVDPSTLIVSQCFRRFDLTLQTPFRPKFEHVSYYRKAEEEFLKKFKLEEKNRNNLQAVYRLVEKSHETLESENERERLNSFEAKKALAKETGENVLIKKYSTTHDELNINSYDGSADIYNVCVYVTPSGAIVEVDERLND